MEIKEFDEIDNEQVLGKCDIYSFHDGHPENSDGFLDLETYLTSRESVGITHLGLFDHNTITTIKDSETIIKQKGLGIQMLNGIELSIGGDLMGHIGLVDFDLEEFENIFYEKYLNNGVQQNGNFQPSKNPIKMKLYDT